MKPQVVDGRLFAFDERDKHLQAYDIYTGRVLWRTDVNEFTRFASMSEGIYTGQGNACVVYDPATGAELHRFPYRVGEAAAKLFVADLRVAGCASAWTRRVYKDRRYRAVNGRTGETLWEQEKGASQPIMVAGEIFCNAGGGAFDVKTGVHIPGNSRMPGGNGCNHPIACEHLFFRRRFTAAYFDIATGKATYLLNARFGCTNILIPACGVLSSPCFSVGCACNHPLETSFCLVHMPAIEGWFGAESVREPMPLGERDPAKWRALVAPRP